MRDGGSIERMRAKCRVWWPNHLTSSKPPASGLLLFGWFVSSTFSSSVDAVVAFALEESSLTRYRSSTIEEVILRVRERMPVLLRDKSSFSILGKYVRDSNSIRECDGKKIFPRGGGHHHNLSGHVEEAPSWNFRCLNVDLQDHHTEMLCENFRSIQLVYDPYQYSCRGISSVPKVHHFYWDGQMVQHCDLHVCYFV